MKQNKNKSKKSYIFNNSMDKKGPELFIDSCNNFTKYINNIHRNEKFNKNYMKFINKSQQTNQQTNNNYSKLNCSQASSGLINSNYIILDNQKLNQIGDNSLLMNELHQNLHLFPYYQCIFYHR